MKYFVAVCLVGSLVFAQLTITELKRQNAMLSAESRAALVLVEESRQAMRELSAADAELKRADDSLKRANERLMRACGVGR